MDIVSSEGTPIYAIEDGEVLKAGPAAGYGNLVTIKHTINNKTAQSIYGHLESVVVKVGDKVVEGQQIGTMGHEGNADGNHLHFAINTTKDNTYVFSQCGDYPKTSDYTIVQQGLCRDFLFSRTVDPIAFIEYNGLVPATMPTLTSRVITKSIKKPVRQPVALAPNPTATIAVAPTAPAKPATTVAPTAPAPKPTVSTSITSA